MGKEGMMIIGLCGVAGSGKDTIADHLVAKHGFVKVALADEIKRTAQRWYGFSDEALWGPSELRNEMDRRFPRSPGVDGPVYLTPRYALQFLGTEVGRTLFPNTWVDITIRTSKDLLANKIMYSAQRGPTPGGTNIESRVAIGVVISDVRFRNEVDAIQAAGGLVARVVRPHAGLTGDAGKHTSETEQLTIPYDAFLGGDVLNDRSVGDLLVDIDSVVLPNWRHLLGLA